MPRVYGGSPGAVRSASQSSGRSASVYRRSTGTPEMVVKRGCPFLSRLIPETAPMGFSGFFSRAGASVFSFQRSFSADAVSESGLISGASAMVFTSVCETLQHRGRRVPSARPGCRLKIFVVTDRLAWRSFKDVRSGEFCGILAEGFDFVLGGQPMRVEKCRSACVGNLALEPLFELIDCGAGDRAGFRRSGLRCGQGKQMAQDDIFDGELCIERDGYLARRVPGCLQSLVDQVFESEQ